MRAEADFQVTIQPLAKGRREYPSDEKYLCEEPDTIVGRIRKDRLLQGWSAAMLSKQMGIPARTIKYHEERMIPDDMLDTEYLKKAAVALGLEEDRYLDDYLKWIDGGTMGEDVNAYIASTGLPICKLHERFGAKEYAVSQWRKGLSRPPRAVYEMIMEFKEKG